MELGSSRSGYGGGCGKLVKIVLGEVENEYSLTGGDDFYIGRDPHACTIYLDDNTISRRQLRVYAIEYDDGKGQVPPLVYVHDLSTNGTRLVRTEDSIDPGLDVSPKILSTSDGPILLNNNDELHVSPTVFFRFEALDAVRVPIAATDGLRAMEQEAFKDRYTVSRRRLGCGAFGAVHLAFSKATGVQLACKIIDLQKYEQWASIPKDDYYGDQRKHSNDQATNLEREIRILSSLNHKNILGFEHAIISPSTAYIFTELVTGGDLMSYVQARGNKLDYVGTAVIMRQLLLAVQYLHSHNIVHRDLKLENILMTTLDEGGRIIISDFGQARFLPMDIGSQERIQATTKARRMFTMNVGTRHYRAPEICDMNGLCDGTIGYTAAVDMWSIGNITAVLISGEEIFGVRSGSEMSEAERDREVQENMKTCNLDIVYGRPEWLLIDKRPKDFVRKLLDVDETKRLTPTQALEHPWFSHPAHKIEFEALYERMTANWRARSTKGQMRTVLRLEGHDAEIAVLAGKSKYF